MQPTWSAYRYHLVSLIWYPYSLVFLMWYPYALFSLYGNKAHCSGFFIVPRIAIVTSQWYDRYCFTEYARTWARLSTPHWQSECAAITECQSIDSLLDSMRFLRISEKLPYILRNYYSPAWLATPCARGYAILKKIIGFIISKIDYCCWLYSCTG